MITLVNCVAPHVSEGAGIPPPGLLSLAASVRAAGLDVRLADLATTGPDGPPDPEAFPQWLGKISPVVGFSTMSNMLPYALEAARYLKRTAPEVIVLLGGCGAQAAIDEIMDQFPFIDFAFQGESETSLPQFLLHHRTGGPWQSTPGLAFRTEGRVVVNPPPPRLDDLDQLPLPAYDLADHSAYQDYIGLLTSRGCPFTCTYCEGSFFRGEHLTTHSVPRVFAEVAHLQQHYGISRFRFLDDNFTVRRERVREFCRHYTEGGSQFQWGILSRVDGLDPDLMGLLAQANCDTVYFGVESGSDKTLREIRKRVTSAQIAQVVPRAREHFPQVVASFMWGFPFETVADFEETLLLAAYLRSHEVTVQLHLWAPMPRSPLFRQYRDQLVYDEGVQSDFIGAQVSRYRRLIESNSTIFAPFYHVPHPGFDEKRAMVAAMGFAE